jgi:hypothetical protein
MVFNATFDNISAISVLLVEETGISGKKHQPTCRKSLTNQYATDSDNRSIMINNLI